MNNKLETRFIDLLIEITNYTKAMDKIGLSVMGNVGKSPCIVRIESKWWERENLEIKIFQLLC